MDQTGGCGQRPQAIITRNRHSQHGRQVLRSREETRRAKNRSKGGTQTLASTQPWCSTGSIRVADDASELCEASQRHCTLGTRSLGPDAKPSGEGGPLRSLKLALSFQTPHDNSSIRNANQLEQRTSSDEGDGKLKTVRWTRWRQTPRRCTDAWTGTQHLQDATSHPRLLGLLFCLLNLKPWARAV